MELQHLNVKIFVQDDDVVDAERFIGIFHGWIREQVLDELLIDVADYRHVPDGPGVLLVGHDAIYSLDRSGGRWGLRYNRRTVLDGSNEDRIRQAFEAAAWACALLEEELRDEEAVKFSRTEFDVFVNDRALAPNSPETYASCGLALESFLRGLLGSGDFELQHHKSPQGRFGVTVRLSKSFALAAA